MARFGTRCLMALLLLDAAVAHAKTPSLGPAEVDVRQSEVTSLATDGLGFLWATSAQGLCRSDGKDWACVRSTCRAGLWADSTGTVWARCEPRALLAVSGQRQTRYERPLGGDDFTLVGVTGDELFLASAQATYVWRSPSGPKKVSPAKASAVARYARTLWLATPQGLVRQHADAPPEAVAAGHVQALAVDIRGEAYATFRDGAGNEQVRAFHPDGSSSSAVYDVYNASGVSLLVDEERQLLWVAHTGGLEAYAITGGRAVVSRSMRHGLPHPNVLSQLLDGHGLWLGTPQGLARIGLDPGIQNIGREEGIDADSVFALTLASDGALWFAQNIGLTRYKGGEVLNIGARNGLTHVDLRSVAQTPDGVVWASGLVNPLVRLDVKKERFEIVTLRNQPPSFRVQMLRAGPTGILWMGLQDGGVGRKDGDAFVSLYRPPLGRGSRVHDVLEDASGAVWAAMADGTVVAISAGKASVFPLTADKPALCLHQDAGGSVWVGTAGAGLYRIKRGEVQQLDEALGLFSNEVYAVAETDDGWIWLSSNRGIFRIEKVAAEAVLEGRAARVQPIAYRVEDGLRTNEGSRGFSPSSVRDATGRIWFAMVSGASAIDARAFAASQPPRAVYVDSVHINGEAAKDLRQAFPVGKGNVMFKYSAPMLWQSPRLRYRTRLMGWQPNFVEQGPSSVAAWAGVPPGRYTFEVQAYITDRPNLHATASTVLMLAPPFYRRWWFIALVIVGASATLLTRIATQRKRARRLSAALQADRTRIAQDIHDSLEQDLTGMKLQVDAASLWLDQDLERSRQHLRRASDLVTDGMVDMRTAIWGLRAGFVKGAEWTNALHHRLQRIADAAGLQLTLVTRGQPRSLPSVVATQLLYIAREAVTNTIKHAEARTLHVDVAFEPNGVLSLTIKDDGRGFDVNRDQAQLEKAGGLGLEGMRARAELLRADFSIGRGEVCGTEVRLRVDLSATARGRSEAGHEA